MSRAQPPRAFRVSSPPSARLCSFIYSPRRPQSPNSTRASATTSKPTKVAVEIHAAANPPPQRLQVPVSALPSFGFVLRSRHNSRFSFSCSVLVANPHRTLFQGHRPPLLSRARVGRLRLQSRLQVSSRQASKRLGVFGLLSTVL